MAVPRIGFMQGRLVAPVGAKIQAFPWDDWRREFALAETAGFALMEWTLDVERLDENPFMTEAGQAEIRALSRRHGVKVETLTGDCFMQAPFWKASGALYEERLAAARRVLEAASALGVRLVVVPLVDGGSLERPVEEKALKAGLKVLEGHLAEGGVSLAFESDFAPARLAAFLAGLAPRLFGVNYDIGNSAALDYDCGEEIAAYGERILNVHVKDRCKGGTTVPLGEGNADLPRALGLLKKRGYAGRYILQTARAADGDHLGAACRYRDLVLGWLDGGAAQRGVA